MYVYHLFYVRVVENTEPTAIPILERHLQFLIDRHSHYSGDILKPAALGDLFSTAWTRIAIGEVVKKGIGHLTKVRAFN